MVSARSIKPVKTDDALAAKLHVGTSGYSYSEWIEAGFYPPGTKSGQMLTHYASLFDITELNHTWYQMPRAEAVARQQSLAPTNFLFTVKLTRTLTHEIEEEEWRKQAALFRAGLAPLLQSKQLAAVLAQMPPSFERSTKNRAYLGALLDELAGLPLAVEFRHDSWINDKVFSELQRRQVTLAIVDEPQLPGLLPPLDVVTNPELFYVRFHGRNARGWRSGKMALQFDYDYADEQLSEWTEQHLKPLARQAKRGVLFFNNHVRGQAPKNARRLLEILAEVGLKPKS